MIKFYYSDVRSGHVVEEKVARKGSWVSVVDPSNDELDKLATEFDLERDLLNDAVDIYETPRIEKEEGDVYVFARYCYPRIKDISTEPILIVHKKDYLITIQRTQTDLLDRLISGKTPTITTQKTKTILRMLKIINLSYEKDIININKQIYAIRTQLKKSNIVQSFMVEFIDTEENLNEYLIALQPQMVMLRNLVSGKYLTLYEDDEDLVEDLTLGGEELIDLIKSRIKTISNIRDAYDSLLANNLNQIFKRLTSIGIFMAVPTITAGLYGMNVALPNADSPNAFWEVIGVAAIATAIFVLIFKKLKWL